MYFFLVTFSFPRDDHSFYKGGYKYNYFKPRLGISHKDYLPPKPYRIPVREKDDGRADMERRKEKEKPKDERGKEHFDLRETIERNSPTRQSCSKWMNTAHACYSTHAWKRHSFFFCTFTLLLHWFLSGPTQNCSDLKLIDTFATSGLVKYSVCTFIQILTWISTDDKTGNQSTLIGWKYQSLSNTEK